MKTASTGGWTAAAIVFLSLTIGSASAQSVWVSYGGISNMHIQYSATASNVGLSPDDPKCTGLRLEMKTPGGAVSTLDSTPVPVDGAATLSGSLNRQGLNETGLYEFSLKSTWSPGPERTIATSQVEFSGTSISGTLLFDETIDPGGLSEVNVGAVSVPPERTLDLGSAAYVGGSITVQGTLVFQNASFSQELPPHLIFRNPVSFTMPPNGYYVLEGAGSLIDGGETLTVEASDGTLQGIQHLYVRLGYGRSKVAIFDSEVHFNSWSLIGYGAELRVHGCRLPGCSLYLRENDDFRFDGDSPPNVFPGGLTVELRHPSAKAVIDGCFIRGSMTVRGDDAAQCEFTNNEISAFVILEDHCAPVFRENIFTRWILFDGTTWLTETDPSLTIENNYFMGPQALQVPLYDSAPLSPIAIGPNYYGDASGPVIQYHDDSPVAGSEFLRNRGARVLVGYKNPPYGPLLSVAPHLKRAPRERRDRDVFPQVWVAGTTMGQNTLLHSSGSISRMVEGRESLFCADITSTEPKLEGVEVHLMVNGQRVDPTDTNRVLHRDTADYGANANYLATSTANFIIPPMTGTLSSIELWADTRGVSGYNEPGAETRIWFTTTSRPLEPNPDRQLNVVIQPIKLYLWGFAGLPAPSAQDFARDLRDTMPPMLPIARKNIHFIPAAPIPYTGVISNIKWIGSYSLAANLAALLGSTRAFWNATMFLGDEEAAKLDFIVGVVPKNGLGDGIDGANLALDRGVLLVDESKPTAVLHEMGHAIGLYLDTEQYDQSPPGGRPVLGVTLFKAEDGLVAGFPSQRGRVRHIPSINQWWYEDHGWTDIMGSVDIPVWPISTTLEKFFEDFRTRLQIGSPRPAGVLHPLPPGMRLLFLRGLVEKTTEGAVAPYYRFVPGSVAAIPVPQGDQDRIPIAAAPAGDDDRYEFAGYDAQGYRLDYQYFRLVPNGGEGPEVDLWWAGFVIANSSVVSWEIIRTKTGEAVLKYDAGGSIANTLQSPSPHSTLGDTVNLRWSATSNSLRRSTRDLFAPQVPPVQHYILLSENGGTTWNGVAAFVDGDIEEYAFPTESLKSGNNISVRLISTNGLATAESRVDGLVLPNRPPIARIRSPQPGDTAADTHPWTLQASVYDPDEEGDLVGSWSSSLDGALGTGNLLDDVTLSAGVHTLTFRAVDTQGLPGEASVQITVGAMTTVDLAMAADALRVRPAGSNPGASDRIVLVPGSEHSADLRLRNTGVATTATLSLYMTPPGGAEALLIGKRYVLQPFDEVYLPATFTPATTGEYRFRGVVEALVPSDPNPTNNVAAWTYSTEPTLLPIDISGMIAGAVEPVPAADRNADGILDAADILAP